MGDDKADNMIDEMRVLAIKEQGPYRPTKPRATVIEDAWRRKLCEWCYDVVDTFRLDREAVCIAFNYFDRYNEVARSSRLRDRSSVQLLAVTSLFMALKIHGKGEERSRRLSIDSFELLSQDIFCRKDIENKEKDVLKTLQWFVNPPTAFTFLFSFFEAIPKHDQHLEALFDVARYLCEISVCVSSIFLCHKQSVIAYASMICGMKATQSSYPLSASLLHSLHQSIRSATDMSPFDAEVREVCSLLERACPDVFNSRHLFDNAINKVSASQEHYRDSSPFTVIENKPIL